MKTLDRIVVLGLVVAGIVGIRWLTAAEAPTGASPHSRTGETAQDASRLAANDPPASVSAAAPVAATAPSAAEPPDDGKLRIIAFGAHPDDAEYKSGGTAAK